ncbi:hypothetical protein [Rahnella sikkimica]|uniref:Uncharacterized protein n=1 Tax=Rahnella sikkimica TaxID=1805933 RepID=A0A2L1UX58_9GAMM|nr:hypothetical protein [Rahnella sikkimica]AVF37539.1 hypothetical protein BV494_21635 [Rahnella sikkimica]
MDSAKDIAREMLAAINLDRFGFLVAVAKGVISLPVNLGYLGYDFMDVEHRRENRDDKYRIAQLIKRTPFNKIIIEKVINVFLDDFISRIDIPSLSIQMSGSVIGKMFFSQVTGIKLGYAISERATTALLTGTIVGAFLSIGSESSRAIYSSRYLRETNPEIYSQLKQMGNLDLIYFLVEDTVKPFEKACRVNERNPEEFDKICKYFLDGL